MFRSHSRFVLRLCAAMVALLFAVPLAQQAEARTSRTRAATGKTTVKSTKTTTAKRSKASVRRYSAKRSQLRRARIARAKAAAYSRDMRALQTPLFKTGPTGEMVPDIRAEAAIIYNPVTHEILWEENAQNSRSIASITKVMTAVVFLEHAVNLSDEVVMVPTDVRAASTTYLQARDRLTADDLLHLLLIGSDNAAARALARISPFGSTGFIDRMNAKARELGLEHTHYEDPSGLLDTNVSSAYDMARLISFASGDERIASIMRKGEQSVVTSRRSIIVRNTNRLVGGDVLVRGGKTGFIRKSGYCLATLLQPPQGDPIAVVVLGARSSAGRFMETKHLFNWLADRTRRLIPITDAPTPPLEPQRN